MEFGDTLPLALDPVLSQLWSFASETLTIFVEVSDSGKIVVGFRSTMLNVTAKVLKFMSLRHASTMYWYWRVIVDDAWIDGLELLDDASSDAFRDLINSLFQEFDMDDFKDTLKLTYHAFLESLFEGSLSVSRDAENITLNCTAIPREVIDNSVKLLAAALLKKPVASATSTRSVKSSTPTYTPVTLTKPPVVLSTVSLSSPSSAKTTSHANTTTTSLETPTFSLISTPSPSPTSGGNEFIVPCLGAIMPLVLAAAI